MRGYSFQNEFERHVHGAMQSVAQQQSRAKSDKMTNWFQNQFAAGLIVLLTLSTLSHSTARAIDGSALQKGKNGYWHLVMPSELTQSMRDSIPQFEVAADSEYAASLRNEYPYGEHAAPFALIRDLNGDGREDVVLDGREGDERRVYLGISGGHAYRWHLAVRELDPKKPRSSALRWVREPPGEGDWIELVPRADGRTDLRSSFGWNETHGWMERSVITCGVLSR